MKPVVKKIIVGLVVAAFISALVYIFVIKPKKEDEKILEELADKAGESKSTSTTSAPKASVAAISTTASKYTPVTVFDNANPIKQGMSGKQVEQLQKYLKKNFKADLGTAGPNKDGIDGEWGPKTQAAFEAANFLMTEGANAGKKYGVLTVSLYNKLGLSNY